ncbi:MAG TPA: S4 domain-containing protein [Thermoanaerobaculia bacterium]|jgi:ribosome-associated heat shock protein Hsp15|nr:S4 domain-containing protein [Thermoanaerobaculia bacterium]
MERPRIDTWLKLVCLFKHRADATEACKGGKVKINDHRAKPAAAVKVGDMVEFYDGGDHYRRVVVQAIPTTNVSKEVARTMYIDETPARQKVEMTVTRERGAGRPTKKDRRDIERLADRRRPGG